MSKLSLNEIRIMQHLSLKKKVPFNNVHARDKKFYRQLFQKGFLRQEDTAWVLKD